MFAWVPGMRRSCSTRSVSGASSLRRAPRRSSPRVPVSQAFVDCCSSVTARMNPPSLRCLARIRSSRLTLRRSNSRRAEDPGRAGLDDLRRCPPVVGSWVTQRTALLARPHIDSVFAASAAPQTVQVLA
jgi:hypothetical protein